jgi:hypothetical protein
MHLTSSTLELDICTCCNYMCLRYHVCRSPNLAGMEPAHEQSIESVFAVHLVLRDGVSSSYNYPATFSDYDRGCIASLIRFKTIDELAASVDFLCMYHTLEPCADHAD